MFMDWNFYPPGVYWATQRYRCGCCVTETYGCICCVVGCMGASVSGQRYSDASVALKGRTGASVTLQRRTDAPVASAVPQRHTDAYFALSQTRVGRLYWGVWELLNSQHTRRFYCSFCWRYKYSPPCIFPHFLVLPNFIYLYVFSVWSSQNVKCFEGEKDILLWHKQ